MDVDVHRLIWARHFDEAKVRMQDGVALNTDVYLPSTSAAHPTVLIRTPYGRRRPLMLRLAGHLTRLGAAVVIQDFRGRYGNGGRFLARELEDGTATLEWLARQRWCDGRIGLLGISLSSLSMFMLAAAPLPAGLQVRTMVNMMGAVDLHSSFYPSGALLLHWALPWSAMMHESFTYRPGAWQRPNQWHDLFRHVPIARVSEHIDVISLWNEVIASHTSYDDAWRTHDARPMLGDIKVPVLHLGGWYDNALGQLLAAYDALHRHRGPTSIQKVIIGPWDHQTLFVGLMARDTSVTRLGQWTDINLLQPVLSWLRRWLLDEKETETVPDALLFLMGQQRWLAAETFPPAEMRTMEFFLTSNGHAQTAAGDGRLSVVPARAGSDGYTYDPSDPAPTVGGAVWPFPAAGIVPGPADQAVVSNRSDVLVYSSDPLEEDLFAIGPLSAALWVASEHRSADYAVKLVDVDTKGIGRIVADGIVRIDAASSDSSGIAPREIAVSLGATAHCFARDHRIRVDVSSSNFPKYDRNLGGLRNDGAAPPARQTVFHGGTRPSRFLLGTLSRQQVSRLAWQPPLSWSFAAESRRAATAAG